MTDTEPLMERIGQRLSPCSPCRWVLCTKVTFIHAPARRDAVCVNCGRKEIRLPSGDDVLDDYEATLERFARR